MTESSNSRVIGSSMKVVFSFMAALILTEFLKVAAVTAYARANAPALSLIIIAALFLFFMIFDTVVWLVFSDKIAVQQNVRSSSTAVWDSIAWLGCRLCEFFVVIWLYDFVNIVRELGKTEGDMKYMEFLARFNLDAALISFGWAGWFIVYHFTVSYRHKDKREQKELRRQGFLHLLFMALFAGVWHFTSTGELASRWITVALTGFLVVVNIIRILFTQPTYYRNHAGLYGA